jgi:hypothetical protein
MLDLDDTQSLATVMRSFRRLSTTAALLLCSLLNGCTSVPTTPQVKSGKTAPAQAPAAGSLLERALRAPATDLASAYYGEKHLFDQLSRVGRGMIIDTPQGRIDADNAGKVKQELQRHLATYETAIKQRGYESIAGVYLGNATTACAHVPSLWLRAMLKGRLGTVKITQNGFTFKLVQPLKDQTSTIVIPGVVVESSLVLSDPANFDFRFRGKVTADGITLRPDAKAIISAWPAWMEPPNRANLSSCTISLAAGQTIVPFSK